MYKNLYSKYKNSYLYLQNGGDITHLFSYKNDKLSVLRNTLKKYIATPWHGVQKRLMTMREYGKYAIDYVRLDVEYEKKISLINTDNITAEQKLKLKEDEKVQYNIKKQKLLGILKQGHAGNLLEHSQWCALQIKKWYSENNDIIKDIDYKTAIICAFFHDIGKAGDCKFNMYDPNKYANNGDYIHPKYCGDVILGRKKFIVNCDKEKCLNCRNENGTCPEYCVIDIQSLIRDIYPAININHVAITAYMHWKFGTINIGLPFDGDISNPEVEYKVIENVNKYISDFKNTCIRIGENPTLKLLKLCIAIGCADIASGTNVRLRNLSTPPLPEKYVSYDGWISFNMYKRYKLYRKMVLEQYIYISDNS